MVSLSIYSQICNNKLIYFQVNIRLLIIPTRSEYLQILQAFRLIKPLCQMSYSPTYVDSLLKLYNHELRKKVFNLNFSLLNFSLCMLGVVNSKKFVLIKCCTSKATDQSSIFVPPQSGSIWSCKAASKSEAVKSTLLNKSCSNQKILADLLYQL